MTLPLDLVLIRHGESEANAAKRLSEEGNHEPIKKLRESHTRSFRLSAEGREQATRTGDWVRKEFYADGEGFGRFFTSEYVRAMETAALLDLPNAKWSSNFYLTERDWGELESFPEDERDTRFADTLRMKRIEPFFWRPTNGESFAELCLRLDRVLFTLHRECTDMKVVIVCHGEVMRAFRVILERMPQQRFREQFTTGHIADRIHNCEVMHYTRKDPETGEVSAHADWVRRIRPSETPLWETGWEKITRTRYSNEELMRIVEDYPSTLGM